MFNPTKSHEKEIQEGQKRIRMGSRVPNDAVSLAYTYSSPLRPEENVQIADLSGFILENVTNEGTMVTELWPNDQGLLTTWDGSPYIYAKNFLLTNQFVEEEPLYYLYELAYPVYDTRNRRGYVNSDITLVDASGKQVSSDFVYKVIFAPTETEGLYRIHLFTNFQKQPNESMKVIYTAYKDGRVIPAYSEEVDPQPAFYKTQNIQEAVLVPNQNYAYYQADGKDIGESQIYVGSVPLKDLDYRTPVDYRYQITGNAVLNGTTYTITTPWIYDTIFSKDHLSLGDDEYKGGYKQVGGKRAIDILADFGNVTPFLNIDASVEVTISSSKPDVAVYTSFDGLGPVTAITNTKTNPMPLPDSFRKQYRAKSYSFEAVVQVDGGEYQVVRDSVSILEGHKEVAGPFEGSAINIALIHTTYPVTIYIKDKKLYAYTNETEVFYVQKYALLTSNSSQIRVLTPSERYGHENWYVRVKNGQFKRQGTTSSGIDIQYFYNVPEYYKQDFDEGYGTPYRKVLSETPEIVGDRKIRVRYAPLYIKQDMATRTYNLQVFVNGIQASIKGWDAANGIVEVDVKLKDIDTITVDYYYEELAFTYRGYYDEKNQRFWHLDLNPSVGHTYTNFNKGTEEIEEVPTFQLINQTVYLYLHPSAKFSASGEMVRNSYESHVLFHTFEEITEPNAILLAKIQIRPNSSMESMSITDTRVRGGGLKESIDHELIKVIEPESTFYWDIGFWDGEPFSENGVVVIRIPSYLTKENGGDFSKEEIERIIKRHIGYGNLPIIEYVEEPKRLLSKPQGAGVRQE